MLTDGLNAAMVQVLSSSAQRPDSAARPDQGQQVGQAGRTRPDNVLLADREEDLSDAVARTLFGSKF